MRKINKKGSVQDLIMVAVILLVFSLAIIVTYKIYNELNTKFQANDRLDTYGKESMGNINNMYPGIIDNSFLFLTVGLSIGAIVLASMVRVHPIFLALFIMVWLIVIFLTAVFSNIYDKVATNPQTVALANQMTYTSHIMSTLPWIVTLVGGLLAIIMYKTWKTSQLEY